LQQILKRTTGTLLFIVHHPAAKHTQKPRTCSFKTSCISHLYLPWTQSTSQSRWSSVCSSHTGKHTTVWV